MSQPLHGVGLHALPINQRLVHGAIDTMIRRMLNPGPGSWCILRIKQHLYAPTRAASITYAAREVQLEQLTSSDALLAQLSAKLPSCVSHCPNLVGFETHLLARRR